MSRTAPPDAERIGKLAERLKKRMQAQQNLDDALLSYMLLVNEVDTASSGKRGIKGFRSGIGGMTIREDASHLPSTFGVHVNVPDDDPESSELASGVLEPWLAGCVVQSQQAGEVWTRLRQDLRAFGRAWSVVYHYDNLWSDDIEEYKSLKEGLKNAKDEDEVKTAEKDLKRYKQDTFPIRWRYVDPRATWTTFDGVHWLPEVVEIRKMTVSDIKSAYPDFKGDEDEETELEVVEWANWNWCAAVVLRGEPEIVHKFEHKLGKSPYTLIEADLMPPNDKGWRWCGGLFYSQFMIDTFDEIMSDLRESHRENTHKPIIISHDPNMEQPETTGGRPEKYKYGPDETIHIWNTEKIEHGPTNELKSEFIVLLQEVKQLIERNMYRPIERGEGTKSGDSGAITATKYQISEQRFKPSLQAMAVGAKDICKSFLRSVTALGEEVFVAPNYRGKKGVIGLTPKQVRGQENLIEVMISRALPVDQSLLAAQASTLMGPPINLSPETVFEQVLRLENPQEEVRKTNRHILKQQAIQIAGEALIARIQQKVNTATPEQLAEIGQMAAGAPDALLQTLASMGASVDGRGVANQLREGQLETPQVQPVLQ